MKTKMLLTGLIILFFQSPQALADSGRFGVHAGFSVGAGHLGSDDPTLSRRNMYQLNIEALPGYEVNSILLGALLDYSLVGQATSAESAGNALGGQEYTIGLGLAYQPRLWKLMLSYDFLGKYSASESDIQFKSPSGFHALAGYRVGQSTYLDLEFSSINYNKEGSGGGSTDISGNPVNHWDFALGLSFSY